jgi:hypothetical protein
MDIWIKEQFGAWTQAIGTVTAALGSTPALVPQASLQEGLQLTGNAMQATGNAVLAETSAEGSPLGRLGNEVQAIGNSVVVMGLTVEFSSFTKQSLVISGDWIQALGSGTAVVGDLQLENSLFKSFLVIGNSLQMIGNSLQALGGTLARDRAEQAHSEPRELTYAAVQRPPAPFTEDGPEAQALLTTGSWIQATGSVLTALALYLREEDGTSSANA